MFFSTVLIFIVFSSIAQTEKTKNGHFVIRYDKNVEAYALASATILNFVWDKLKELDFKPPKKVDLFLVKSDRNTLGIHTVKKYIILQYTALDPSITGANYVYGFCHEMGHLCMSNITPNDDNWMTQAYREGWAHVFGEIMSVLLHEKYGVDVWSTPYDYLELNNRNTAKRAQSIETSENVSDMFISELFWRKLVDEKGMGKIPFFFRQIKSNKVMPPDADKKFRAELVKLNVSRNLLYYFDQNKQHLIKLQ